VTTQGMGVPEMSQIASLIGRAVRSDVTTDAGQAESARIADEVTDLVTRFPAYPEPAG
jgi:glycine hydroxymethyltransferase